MRRSTYIGKARPELFGKTVLLFETPENTAKGVVMAQFDFEGGIDETKQSEYCFGWWPFYLGEFSDRKPVSMIYASTLMSVIERGSDDESRGIKIYRK